VSWSAATVSVGLTRQAMYELYGRPGYWTMNAIRAEAVRTHEM
jgi:hypothetical protein